MSDETKKWLLIAACASYVVCPLDGDFVPFVGWIDDLIAIWWTWRQIHTWAETHAQDDTIVMAELVNK